MNSKKKRVFLESKWQRLVSINYVVDAKILEPYIPAGTELELFNNKCFVSLVAFRYDDTKLLRFKVPFHTQFEEINLRFYVRRKLPNRQWRSEVAFTKLFFPKPALSAVANSIYKENYETRRMRHTWKEDEKFLYTSYGLNKSHWHQFSIISEKDPIPIEFNSPAYFFSKHYWGTSQIDSKASTEYMIEHPEWFTYETVKADINFDFGLLFGDDFESLTNSKPDSVQMFDGSDVTIYRRSILC